MSRLLDLDALRRSEFRHEPFEWAVLHGIIDPQAASVLCASFPSDGFSLVSSASTEKPYRMEARVISTPESPPALDGLPELWCDFLSELSSPAYRRAIGELASLQLEERGLEITLWRYDAHCFLAPHPDKETKLVSHIFYMTPHWEPAWGGCFRALRGPCVDDVAERVTPVLGTSVVLQRSDRSWHAVEEVSAVGVPPRHSVQVIFHR
jgi:hypothetical protein